MHNICLYGMKCVWLRLRRKCLHPPDNRQDQAVKPSSPCRPVQLHRFYRGDRPFYRRGHSSRALQGGRHCSVLRGSLPLTSQQLINNCHEQRAIYHQQNKNYLIPFRVPLFLLLVNIVRHLGSAFI